MKIRLNTRIEERDIDALKKLAIADDRSTSNLIQMVLRRYIRANGGSTEPARSADSAPKPKPAGPSAADSHSGDSLGDYASKYGKGQVKRGEE